MAARAPQPHPAARAPWRAAGWALALAAALAVVAWDGVETVRHYTKASAIYGVAVHAPPVDAGSPTGFADGRRTIIYPAGSVDAQHWITQTQQMFARGEWRVRHVDDDNAPFGRPVHWGSPFRWWLGLCALVDHAFSGRALGAAVEHAALFANPALLAVLLAGLVPWVARRFGGAAAAFLALAMVGTTGFQAQFTSDNPDHHGLIQAAAMVCVVAIVGGGAGWVRDGSAPPHAWSWLPDLRQARRAFAVSALAGGLGLWVSAVSTIQVFAAIGLGALWGAWAGRRAPASAHFEATLWRRWGAIGAAASLAAYVVEYFPGHLGWRLEVNHPLYALAWLGAGEILTQLTGALSRGRLVPPVSAWPRVAAGLAAVALPVVAIVAGGERVFAVGHPFVWEYTHDYVPEGRGFAAAVALAGLNLTTLADCAPMLSLVVLAVWLARPATPVLARAVLAVPFSAAAFFWLMAFRELRWWGLGFGFLLSLSVPVVALAGAPDLRRQHRLAFWLLVLVLFAPGLVQTVQGLSRRSILSADNFLSLVERDLAHTLRQRAGDGPLVVLSAPATTSRMIYFGSARGLGTGYWENLEGSQRAAAIYAARTADEAHALVRAAGVTHIVFLSWDDFTRAYIRLSRGLSKREPIAESAFGLELLRSEPPPWLRRLPDHVPDHPALRDKEVLIFEVTDRTQPERALVRRVNDLLYRGRTSEAAALRPELEKYPEDLAAQIALVRVEGTQGNEAALAAALGRARPRLDQAPRLEPEDRIYLVAILASSGHAGEAREQLRSALRDFDEAALRRLPPGPLMSLLALSERLGVPWPHPALHELAAGLVPPDGRL